MNIQTRRQALQHVLFVAGVFTLPRASSQSTGTPSPATTSAALPSPAAPSAATTDLRISLPSLGGKPDNSKFDNTPAFNAALAKGVTSVYIPQGSWYFLTKPNAVTYPLELLGSSLSTSTLVRRYPPQSTNDGLLTIKSHGCRVARLGICAGANTASGAGIALIADTSSDPDYTVLEDLYISSEPKTSGTWANAVVIDGSARTGRPPGARDINMRNCFLFASTNAACRINSGENISFRDGGMFPAGGTTGRLQITGTSVVGSQTVNVDTGYLGGLSVENCQYINVRAAVIAGDITNTQSARDVVVTARCVGSVQGFWTRGRVLDPGSA